MNIVVLIIAVVYFLGMLAIGWASRKYASRSAEDYWVAGGQTKFWVNLPAVIAIYISGGSFLGIAGLAYADGAYLPTMFILGAMIGVGLSVILTGAQFRRAGAVTFAEYMGKLFGDKRVSGVAALMFGLYAFGYLVPQFQGGGIAFTTILGVPYWAGILVMGGVLVLYVLSGGFWAVTWTDAVQGVLLWVSMLMLAAIVLAQTGGVASLWSQVQELEPAFASSDGQILAGLGLVLTWAFAWATFPAVVSRVLASQNEVVATRSLALGGLLYAIFHFCTIFVVAPAAILVAPNLESPDFALIAVIESYLPAVLVGVVLAGLLSALMSSAAALLMAATSALIHDVYVGLLRPSTSGPREVLLGRAATLVLGILAILATIRPPAIIGIVAAVVAGFAASALFFPMVLSTWWSRTTGVGAIVGMFSGAGVYVVSFALFPDSVFTQVLYGIAASILGTVIGSFAMRAGSNPHRNAVLAHVRGSLSRPEAPNA